MPSTQATAISSLIDQFVLNYAPPAFHNLELNRILHLMTLLADGGGGGTGGTWGAITGNITDQIDLTDYIAAQIAGSGSATWGNITGTLTDQADLVAYIAAQVGAVPTWDATLTAGINTGQAPTQTQNGTLGAGHLWWTWILKPDSGDPSSPYGTFNSFVDDSFVDGSGNRDHVFNYMSYNYPGTGVTPLAGEAAWRFGVERFYTNGSGNLFEFHIPELKTTAGDLFRLFSIYVNRDNGRGFENHITQYSDWFPNTDQTNPYARLQVSDEGFASFKLDGSWGTGGVGGTTLNTAGYSMLDGTNTSAAVFLQNGTLRINTTGPTEFGGGSSYISFPSYVQFSDGVSPYEAGVVHFYAPASGPGGFWFNDGEGNNLVQMLHDGIGFSQPMHLSVYAQPDSFKIVNISNNADATISLSNLTFYNGGTQVGSLTFTATNYVDANVPWLLPQSVGIWGNTGQVYLASIDPTNAQISFIMGGYNSLAYEYMRISLNGGVLIGKDHVDEVSSMLTVSHDSKGVLFSRMTTTQRIAIASPAEGLEVYDTDLHKKMVFDGTTWQACW